MIVSIEGNIGTGKTTFLQYLEKNPENIIIYEPVDDWLAIKDCNTGVSIFETYYKDKQRNAFLFQILALQTRFENLVKMSKKHKGRIMFCERSIYTDFHIFAKVMHRLGNMSDIEMQVYTKCHKFMCELADEVHIGGMIYLRASTEVCMQRVRKRNRLGEDQISLEFLTDLHDAHEHWLNDPQQNVLVLNAETSLDNDETATLIKTFVGSKLLAAVKS
jgi:deoxyadenosine/deoxycytidine kinase